MLGILILCILGIAFSMTQHRSTQPHHSHPTAKTSSLKRSKPLTMTEFNHHPKLAFGSVIYFAIKHVNIQRWQEVSDFSLGWQVEFIEPPKGTITWFGPTKILKKPKSSLNPTGLRLSIKIKLFTTVWSSTHSVRCKPTPPLRTQLFGELTRIMRKIRFAGWLLT